MYNLMIVEDEEVIRRGLVAQFNWEQLGFRVISEASNGKEALDLLRISLPDIILLDIRMPVMDGIGVMEAIYSMGLPVKVIVLSGYDDFEYARKSLQFGVYGYLLKPTKDNEIKELFIKLGKELDRLNANKVEIRELKKDADIGLKSLKKEKLKEVIEGNYQEEDTRRMSRLFNVDNGQELFYCVTVFSLDKHVLIKFIDLYDLEIWQDTCFKLSGSFADIQIIEMLYTDENTKLALITATKEYNTINFLIPFISEIKDTIEILIKQKLSEITEVSAGIGEFQNGIFSISKSYRQAIDALKIKFFLGTGKIYTISQASEYYSKTVNSSYPYPDVQKAAIAFSDISKWGNKAYVEKLVKEFITGIKVFRMKTSEVYIKMIEFIIGMSFKLEEKNINIDECFQSDIQKTVEEIINFLTIKDLEDWLLKYMENLRKYVHDEGERESEILIEKIKKYIFKNINKKITTEDIAKLCCMSATYFSAFFKKKTGVGFIDFLTNVRINKAKELLLKPGIKVFEVAFMVGYNDFRHFSRMFHKVEGLNPKEFQRKFYENNIWR